MFLQSSRATPPSALVTTAPGVVTAWKVQSGGWLQQRTASLNVFRQVGGEYEVVAKSATAAILDQDGVQQFPTRIPVGAGVTFGATASASFPACLGGVAGDVLSQLGPDLPVGGKAKIAESDSGVLMSLAVVVEPDADGDGFGDETQDKCPQSAAAQGACPEPPGGGVGGATVKLKGKPKLEGNVVAVKLTASTTTELTVIGSIRGKRAAKPVSKTVNPGETGRAYLTLKKSVKQRLANLPRERKLRMVVEVKAAGSPTVSAEISLPGRKKQQGPRAPR